MVTPSRHAVVALSERLRNTPQAFELLQALLLLERERPSAALLGQSASPQGEAVRLRGPLTASFAVSQVESLMQEPGQPITLTTPVFGLGGPDGPLPYAYQEWLAQRARLKDHAPAEFLDIFQHRLLSLLYRVLGKHRLALGFRTPQDTPVQAQLLALCGLLPDALQQRLAVPDATVTARTALFAGSRRSLAGFAALVSQQFSVSTRFEAYCGSWRDIPAASRSCLQRNGRNLSLGRSAIAGIRVWDEHAGIRLILGPLSSARAEDFLPSGSAHAELASLAGFYFGPDLDCELRLLVRPGAPLTLDRSAPPRLRWSSGLHLRSEQLQQIDTRLRQSEVA